jgi:hypothetical protein
MNLSEQGNAGDVSLDALAVMAQAQDEGGECASSCSLSQRIEVKDKSGNVIGVKSVTICRACCGEGQRAKCGNGFLGIGGG